MENQYKSRTRIEVSTSVKGVHTYSCTVEIIDSSVDEVLEESDKLVAELDKRYRIIEEGR